MEQIQVTVKIISFPDEWTQTQQEADLADIHARLVEALKSEHLTVKLSIDDIMQLGELIEQRLGPDWFDDDLD